MSADTRVRNVATYLGLYLQEYRREYARTSAMPGFPRIHISPFLNTPHIRCRLAADGAVIISDPADQVEPYITIEMAGFTKPPSSGLLGKARASIIAEYKDTRISVTEYPYNLSELTQRLTVGGINAPANEKAQFGQPFLVRDVRFINRSGKHFDYHDMEIHQAATRDAYWDVGNVAVRVYYDVRRDYAFAFFQTQNDSRGHIGTSKADVWREVVNDRLSKLAVVIEDFTRLLRTQAEADESVFHDFLRANPILLDIYGVAESKPQLRYPSGETSARGKSAVIPDFIIRRPGNFYELIELERPSKNLGTQAGHATSVLTQSAGQLGEWIRYIEDHYELIRDRFPDISQTKKRRTKVIMGKAHARAFGGHPHRAAIDELRNTFGVDDVVTYDDLIERARAAYVQLSNLGPERESSGIEN